VGILLFSCKKGARSPSPTGTDDGCKMQAAGLRTKIRTRLTRAGCLRWRILQHWYWCVVLTHTFFGFDWGQRYLATLVTRQNCTKMLRNLTFVVQFAYFCTRSNKRREQQNCYFFSVFLEQLSLQKATFDLFWATFLEIASNFLGNLVQVVESPKIITISWFHGTRLNDMRLFQNRIPGSLYDLTLTPFWQGKRQRK